MVPRCNCEARRHERMQRYWVSPWTVLGAVTASLLSLLLGARGGSGKPLPSCSLLQLSGPSMSELPFLPSFDSDNLEGRTGRSCSSF